MANSKPTVASVDKKTDLLRNDFMHITREIKEDITEIKEDIKPMALGWLEFTRKVNDHHEPFREDQKLLKDLREAEYPVRKVMPEDNGEHNKRAADKWFKNKWAKYALFVSIVAFIASNIGSCAYIMIELGEMMDKIPH